MYTHGEPRRNSGTRSKWSHHIPPQAQGPEGRGVAQAHGAKTSEWFNTPKWCTKHISRRSVLWSPSPSVWTWCKTPLEVQHNELYSWCRMHNGARNREARQPWVCKVIWRSAEGPRAASLLKKNKLGSSQYLAVIAGLEQQDVVHPKAVVNKEVRVLVPSAKIKIFKRTTMWVNSPGKKLSSLLTWFAVKVDANKKRKGDLVDLLWRKIEAHPYRLL
jgi:hypothetical protein